MATTVTANHHQAIGRRKEAVARVRIMPGQGMMTVNGKPINEVFRGLIFQKAYQKPFELTKTIGQFSVTAKVLGGGPSSQVQAFVHGAARSLSKVSQDNRDILKKAGLLTRDARVRERRKYGLAHAARAKKSSPKR